MVKPIAMSYFQSQFIHLGSLENVLFVNYLDNIHVSVCGLCMCVCVGEGMWP